jgi:hypothetical protein
VIQLRHRQPSLSHSGLAKDIEDLWEPWMKEVDQLLEDAALVESVYDAQGKRHRKSRTHGRTQTPAEVVLRLMQNQTSSASWYRCRKPRTRSSRTMKCSPNPEDSRSNNTSGSSGAHREWWLPTQRSTV